jgi:uncharacterized damage-inducible protein DinB
MTRDERCEKLESFGAAPALLFAALKQLPKKTWMFKPSPEKWSIHDVILHLADSEASAYICCRRLIAEPGSAVLRFDPAVWAGTLGYFHQSTKEALEIIRRLRRMTYAVLKGLPPTVWSHTVEDPRGGKMSLEQFLDFQEQHIPHHIKQMKGNYLEWLRLHPPRQPATRPRSRAPMSSEASATTHRSA